MLRFLLVFLVCSCGGNPVPLEREPPLRAVFSDPKPTGEIVLDPISVVVDSESLIFADGNGWRLLR